MQPTSLADINVRVLPRPFVKEYKGTTAKKEREVEREDWATVQTLADAITTRHGDSAHFQALQVPGFDLEGCTYPRVGRTWALNLWKDDDLPPEALPWFDVIVLDLDHGAKKAGTWADGPRPGDQEFMDLLQALRARHGFAWYLSRSGARLIGRLDEPLPVSEYEDWASRFLLELDAEGFPVFTPDAHGHHVDAACFDLGRLFKLPLVPKSFPEKAGLAAWYEMRFSGSVDFAPTTLLPWTFGRRSGGIGRPTTPPPTNPPTFTKTDLKALRGRDYWDTLTRPEPIGPPGDRHDPMLRTAGSVARALKTTNPVVVYGVLLPSVRASVTPADREADLLGELWTIANYVAASVEADQEAQEDIRRAVGLARFGAYGRIAELTGCDPSEAGSKIALATNSGIFYPFDEDAETYVPVPYKVNQLAQAFLKHCPNLATIHGEKGGFVADRHLALKYTSTDVSEIRYVYGSNETRADLNHRRLYLPACGIRPDLVPTYHARVDEWLAALGGPHYQDLLNWLALYPDLNRPLCALYLHGEKGTGKGVLARGLASLFGAEPVDYGVLGDRFQAPLLKSPLLFADESVQLNHFRAGHGTSIFRTILGNGSHQIEQKGLDQVWVEGFVRVLVGANNSDALKIREDLSADDVAAIQERVGYIEIPRGTAANFIHGLTWDEVGEMIARQIPEHILHLAETRALSPELQRSRFASWESPFARTVKLDIGATRIVGEVIGRWFERIPGLQDPNVGLFAKDGLLYVNTTNLQRTWGSVVDEKSNKLPSSKAMGTALRALAPEGMARPNKTVRMGEDVVRAWALDPEKIAAVLDQTDADSEAFRAVFHLGEPEPPQAAKFQPAAKAAPPAPTDEFGWDLSDLESFK